MPQSLADLEHKYPVIYARAKPRGGPGWITLLDTLLAQLQARADAGGIQACALHTREKFGRLSLRFMPLDPADVALVNETEKRSEHICEVCGGPGRLIQEGWLRTRCQSHQEEKPTWPTSAR